MAFLTSLRWLFFGVLAVVVFGAGGADAQTIPVARADVDRDCTVTKADATIVQGLLGKRTGQPDFNANADVDQNGVINNTDLTFVARNVGRRVCTQPPPPPAAPTIVATVTPPPNAAGWNNSNVTVSFACTNAVSCPAPVTVTTEGAGQSVSRTVANTANVTATAAVALNIDKTPPVLVVAVPSAATPGASIPIPVSATDLSGLGKTTLFVSRAIADSRVATPFGLTWTVPATMPAGTEVAIEIIGEDRAGNIAGVRRVVSVNVADTTAPSVALSAPAAAGPGMLVPLTIQAADDRQLARVLVTRGGAAPPQTVMERAGEPFSFQTIGQIPDGLAEGTIVRFTATATDAAGNSTPASADVRVVTSVESSKLEVTVDPLLSPTFQNSGYVAGTIGRATVQAPPTAPPLIASISPASGRQGQAVDLVVTGIATLFSSLSQVTLGPGITVQSVTASAPTSLTARIVIGATAGIGPRLVAVSTGRQEAILPSAFTVMAGAGSVSGRVVALAATPIASAQICRADIAICVASGADGRFLVGDVPADVHRLVVSASGFDSVSVAIALQPNLATTVGDVTLVPVSQPPPPPVPNAPPITPALAVVLGRGATALAPGGNPEVLQKLIRDAIIAVGGSEIGVLDAAGQQLNPRMVGAGVASFTDQAVAEIANDMIAGDSMSLAKLFQIYMGSLQFPDSVPLPTLSQLIAGFQAEVDAAWANPSSSKAPMVMLLFNQGRVPSPVAPRVNFDTQFNALQFNVMTGAFMAFVHRFLPEPPAPAGTMADARTSAPVAPGTRPSGWRNRVLGIAAALLPRLPGAGGGGVFGSLRPGAFGTTPAGSLGRAGFARAASFAASAGDQSGTPSAFQADRPGSLMWETVVTTVLPSGGWTAAKNAGGLCDGFLVSVATWAGGQPVDGKTPQGQQLAQDPYAKFLPAPSCKTAIELIELLATSGSKTYLDASKSFTKFFGSEKATVASMQRLQQQYQSQSYQNAWKAAKNEARILNITNKAIGVARGLVEGSLSKMQGEIVDTIFKLEVQLVIESLRPREPFIAYIEQMNNPETTPPQPSRILKITVSRSPNDKGEYDSPDIIWRYQLFRGRSGAIAPIVGKQFPVDDDDLIFYDEVPADGTYVYAVRALRQVGYPLSEQAPAQNTFIDKTLGFLGSFFSTAVKIGGNVAFSMDSAKIALGPIADIYKGVRIQYSNMSEPEQFYVSTAPPVARPPASLAVSPLTGQAFLSVPAFGTVFKVGEGGVAPYAVPNFATPGAAGLAIDSVGDIYVDNAASDALYGGRVFAFKNYTGARDLAGTVNYFSQLLMFANPVAVQALLVANGPYGEQLFIADAGNQRVTTMTLPWKFAPGVTSSRNVSQPYAQSPTFNFGPTTAMAMRDDFMLAVTQNENVMLMPQPNWVQSLFDVNQGAPSPFTQLSGVVFDTYGNMFVSDSTQGTITEIPRDKSYAFHGLAGVDAVGVKKLTVQRGLRRPSEIKLNGTRDGLVYFDGERAYAAVRFGMAGQITDAGGLPLSGAEVYVPEKRLLAVTDADGVYVLPNLAQAGASPVLDFVVRYQGQSVSYRQTLDIYTHNVVDLRFAPTPPPAPGPPAPGRPQPPPSDPPTPKPSGPETISVAFEFPGTPDLGPNTCPRGAFLAPAYGIGTTNPTTTVTGLLSNRRFSNAVTLTSLLLVVNGTATSVPLPPGGSYEFSTDVGLVVGENVMTIALPASILKPIGCADGSLNDATPVVISPAHRVFHDPRPDVLARYRATTGFDVAVRAIVREAGVPLAGLGWTVPGTSIDGSTDGDGIFQLNLPKGQLAGATGAADQLSSGFFTQIGGIVALLRADRRAESLAALNALLLQAAAATDSPPPAASTSDALLARILQVEGTAGRLVQVLESVAGIPATADIDALEALGTQLAGLSSNGQVVIRCREYPNLSFTVSVK